MKSFYQLFLILFLTFLFGCKQQQTLTMNEKNIIEQEVKAAFNLLVDALNQKDADAWSRNYSQGEFVSAFAMTDYYSNRAEWIETIKKYFEMRESQNMTLTKVRVTPLSQTLALMTSEDNTEMLFTNGETMKSRHVFTLVWSKEKDGWKIIHSHESWIDVTNK